MTKLNHSSRSRNRRIWAAIIMISGAVFGLAQPATADSHQGGTSVIEIMKSSPASPFFADEAVQQMRINGNTVSARGDNLSIPVELPLSTTPERNIERFTSLSDDSSYSIVPVALTDGSVAIHSVLHDESAPTTFDYKLTLPEGSSLEVQQSDGSVIARDATGATLAFVAPPWAKSGNGADVPTYYTVKGTVLTQHISVDGATDFPIVADPWLGVDLVSYYNFTAVSGQGWRLNVGPTAWARGYTGNPLFPTIGAAGWDELRNKMTSAQRSRLNDSGRDQYICHMGFAGTDPEWNMELWKADKSLSAWIASKCN